MSRPPSDAVEAIGFAAPRLTSGIHPAEGPAIGRHRPDRLARAHGAGGLDRARSATSRGSTGHQAALAAPEGAGMPTGRRDRTP